MIAQYGRYFAKEVRIDCRFHRLLDDAFSLRQIADYTAHTDVEAGEVRRLIEEGRSFLEAARAPHDEARERIVGAGSRNRL